jgi:hypothetical protein
VLEKTTKQPSLQEQTMELGRTLKEIADNDPYGTPSPTAATVFAGWLALAGPTSREPTYLADVADNFDVFGNTNKDLFELFDILDNYIEVDDEDPDDNPPRTFIGLPLIAG